MNPVQMVFSPAAITVTIGTKITGVLTWMNYGLPSGGWVTAGFIFYDFSAQAPYTFTYGGQTYVVGSIASTDTPDLYVSKVVNIPSVTSDALPLDIPLSVLAFVATSLVDFDTYLIGGRIVGLGVGGVNYTMHGADEFYDVIIVTGG